MKAMKYKKIIGGISAIFMVLILTACQNQKARVVVPQNLSQSFVISSQSDQNSRQKKLLVKFLLDKMITDQGIYTNYRNVSGSADLAHGHQMLSESSGLWLLYLATSHQYKKFRRTYQQTKKTFNQKNQFSYLFDPKTRKKSNVNATLDDLRIIRALQMYATLTHSKHYRYEAAKRFALLKTGSLKNGKIADFYDAKSHKQSSDSSLAYYDFVTLKYFESVNQTGKKIYKKQLNIVRNGYLGDAFPLYAASYQLKEQVYSGKALNTSEALETILHLAEIGKVKTTTLSWLKNQISTGHLYNSYSTLGIVHDKSQSAANYALAAMIFACSGDNSTYKKAMHLAWNSQVIKVNSPIYGGLGNKKTTDAFSYNNLETLLATEY